MIDEEEKLEELLCDWELSRQQGNELTVEELCADAPELLDRVRKGIDQLKATSWMLEDAGVETERPETLAAISHDPRETALPDSDVTITEFVRFATDSGVLSDADIEELNQHAKENQAAPVVTFATKLIENKILTDYQARAILEQGKSPLLLDRYIILDTVGSGGMGLVFKALHRSMERVVALKVLPRYAVNSEEKVSRFQREVKATARLSHPNVVTAYDAHESNGTYFLVMEFVDGVNLMEHVEQHGPMSAGDAANIILQVADGLEAAHKNQIIHRDIKPTNIMLSNDGVAKLLDLGLARTKELAKETIADGLTRDGLTMGTVDYMSPEQALDSKEADAQSDLYSLGCTLYFLLIGKPPFERSTTVKTIIAHREDAPPALTDARKDIPKSLEKVFSKLVAKVPEERYGSVAELRHDLVVSGVAKDLSGSSVTTAKPNIETPSSKQVTRDYSLKRESSGMRIWLPVAAMAIASLITGFWLYPLLQTRSLATNASQRDIAKWALAAGYVDIKSELGSQSLSYVDELPDSDFEITRLQLVGDNERLSLSAIGKLKLLNTLEIYEFHDFNLRDLKDLPALTSLTINGGSAGDTECAAVAELRFLRSLDLSNIMITDKSLAQIIEMNWLDELYLEGVDCSSEGIRSLSAMSQLEKVDLSWTEFNGTDIEHLPRNLITLVAKGCDINDEDISKLGNLKRLTALDITETEISDAGLARLADLKNLEELSVSGQLVSASSLKALSKLPKLSFLVLDELDVTQECLDEIVKMPILESLSLDNSTLDDKQLLQLAKIETLRALYIVQSDVTDVGLERFLEALPECEVYDELE